MRPWKKVCVVGIGRHARSRLIPAILANGQELVGIVSRQSSNPVPPVPLFATLDAALSALPGDTLFVLATPPALHHEQALSIASAGRDVLIEKPAFLTFAAAREVVEAARSTRSVVVEGYMHRQTTLFARFVERWQGGLDDASLAIDFLIPALPEATFRQTYATKLTCLYDIGCYVLSLLVDLKLPLRALALDPSDNRDGRVTLTGILGTVSISARIGIGETYKNEVTVRRGGFVASYHPFFYGRPGEQQIVSNADGEATVERLSTADAFARMLAIPRVVWLEDQPARAHSMLAVTECLERLAADLGGGRAAPPAYCNPPQTP